MDFHSFILMSNASLGKLDSNYFQKRLSPACFEQMFVIWIKIHTNYNKILLCSNNNRLVCTLLPVKTTMQFFTSVTRSSPPLRNSQPVWTFLRTLVVTETISTPVTHAFITLQKSTIWWPFFTTHSRITSYFGSEHSPSKHFVSVAKKGPGIDHLNSSCYIAGNYFIFTCQQLYSGASYILNKFY